jgi:4-amino-4-deoxy-L-arabinose transferase-like glycosyltransferase
VKREDFIALGLAVAAMLASILMADRLYEGLPHLEDEFAFLWEAKVMAQGRISLPTPLEPRSFLVPFVVDFGGQRFGKYPPGWPAALSLGVRFNAYWAVNAFLAGCCIWLIYRLGSKVAGKGVGILSGALALSSPMLLMLSGSMLAHMFSLFLTCAFILAWFDLFPFKGEEGRGAAVPQGMLIAIAGLSLGLLVITRPLTAVGIAIPFLIHGSIILLTGNKAQRMRALAIAGIAMIIAGVLPFWQFALTGDPMRNLYTLWWEYDRVGFGPGFGVADNGHSLYWAFWNARRSLNQGLHDLFGWPYFSWIFLPFGMLALRRRYRGWLLLAVFPSLVLAYGVYWVGSWLFGPRYYFESLPGLAIISAMGIGWLAGWIGNSRKRSVARSMAVRGLVLLLFSLDIFFYLPPRLAFMNHLYGISRQAQQPFEVAPFERALVIVHPVDSWTEYGSLLTLTAPFSRGKWVIVYSRGLVEDARLAAGFSGWPVFHYYADEPYVFNRTPRMTIIEVQE